MEETTQTPRPLLNDEHSKDERTWAMFLHLSQLANLLLPLAGLVAPILIWQLKKDQLPALDQQGKMR
jgi:uncharacterized Tic20 family protein